MRNNLTLASRRVNASRRTWLTRWTSTLCTSAFLLFASGCGGGSSPTPVIADMPQQAAQVEAPKKLVNAHPKLVGTVPLPDDQVSWVMPWLAIDHQDNCYVIVSAAAGYSLLRMDRVGNFTTVPASLDYPLGLATDVLGNIYVSDFQHLQKIAPDGTVTAPYPQATGGPIAVDARGNLYVGGLNVTVTRPGGSPRTLNKKPFTYGLSMDLLTLDSAGNVIGTIPVPPSHSSPASYIEEVTAKGDVKLLATGRIESDQNVTVGYRYARGIAVDPSSDEVYFSDPFDYSIKHISPKGVVSTAVQLQPPSGPPFLPQPTGLAFNRHGHLYFLVAEKIYRIPV